MLKFLVDRHFSCTRVNSINLGGSGDYGSTGIHQQTVTKKPEVSGSTTQVNTVETKEKTETTEVDKQQHLDDKLTVEKKEVLNESEKKSLNVVLDQLEKKQPTGDLHKIVGPIVKKLSSMLNGESIASQIENATKKFTIMGKGFGERSFDTLIKDKKGLEGQIKDAHSQIEQLNKVKSHTTNENDLRRLNDQISKFDHRIILNEAKLEKINDRLTDKFSNGLTVTNLKRYTATQEQREELSSALIQSCLNDPEKALKVAGDKNTPPQVLAALADKLGDQDKIRNAILANPHTSGGTLAAILEKDSSLHTRMDVARHPNASPQTLTKLADHDDANVKNLVAGNRNTPPSVLDKLADHKDWAIQLSVAKNPNTSADTLKKLAGSADVEVKDAVVNHPGMTTELLVDLCDTNDLAFIELAVHKLPFNDSEEVSKVGEPKFGSLLMKLAEHPNAQVRQAVAGSKFTESYVLQSLSKDADYGVAREAQRNLSLQSGTAKFDDYTGTFKEIVAQVDAKNLEMHLGDYMIRYDKAMSSLQELKDKLPDIKTPEGLKTCETVFKQASQALEQAVKLIGEGAGTGGSGKAAEKARKEAKDILGELTKLMDAKQLELANTKGKQLESHTGTDLDELKKLAGDTNTDQDTLKKLASDKDPAVREAVARNSNTDLRTLLTLAKDADPGVRKALEKDPRVSCARNLVEAKITTDVPLKISILIKEKEYLQKHPSLSEDDLKLLTDLEKNPSNYSLSSEEQTELNNLKAKVVTDDDYFNLGDDDKQKYDDLEDKKKLVDQRALAINELIKKVMPDTIPDSTGSKPMEKLKGETLPNWLQEGVNVDMSGVTPESKKKTIFGVIESALPKGLRHMVVQKRMKPVLDQIKKNMADNPDISYAVMMMDRKDAINVIKSAILANKQDLHVTKPTDGTSTTYKLTQEQRDKLLEKFGKNQSLDDMADVIYQEMNANISDKAEFGRNNWLKSVKIGGVEYEAEYLGSGACGDTFLLTDPKTNKQLVAKQLTATGQKATDLFLREIDCHRYATGRDDLKNDNVAGFVSIIKGPPPIHIMECVSGKKFTDVQEGLKDDKLLTDPQRTLANKLVMRQIISGMVHVQENRGMMHRDLKPDNIMIDKNTGEAKIIDFGVGETESTTGDKTTWGTLTHMAPELADVATSNRDGQYDKRVDTYSLGVMLYQSLLPNEYDKIVNSQEVQDAAKKGTKEVVTALRKAYLANLGNLDDQAKDLLRSMLDEDPTKRPRLSDVLEHPYFVMSIDQEEQARQLIKDKAG